MVTDVNGGSLITLIGGSGDDELDLSGSTMGWAIDQVAGTATSGSTSGQISEFETITATDFNDDILGDSILDRINGGDGDDTLEGSGFSGNVDLRGGDGNDTLVASSRADQFRGEDGNDTFLYDDTTDPSFLDNIFGGSGVDKLLIQGQADGDYFDLDLIDVQSIEEIEFDTIGPNTDITLELNEGEFTVTGEEFANDLLVDGYIANGSTEVIYIKLDNEHELDLSGWTFQDWGSQGEHVSILGSTTADTITGTISADSLNGGAGTDTVESGSGNDTVEGGAGADSLNGGFGTDTVSYASSTAGVIVDLLASTASGGDASGDSIFSFENLIGSDHADNLTGTLFANTIDGRDGSDLIQLQNGGDDDVDGGDGNDGIIFGAAFDANDTVDGGDGTFDQFALQGDYAAGVTLANVKRIEQVVLFDGSLTAFGAPGTKFYDYDLTLVDTNVAAGEILEFQANSLRVGEDFTLDASAELDGAVLTFGGFGTHDLTGSQADDGFFFGVGRFGLDDKIDGQGEIGIDSVGIQGDYSAGYTFGVDQLIDIELLALFNSTFSGASSSPFSYDLTMVDANVAAGKFLIVNANQLASDEILTFDGSAETDGTFRFFSGAGADSISASQNGDIIGGGGGADALMGNLGNDTFLYNALTDSTVDAEDKILDFTIGDVISLLALDADASLAGNQTFAFIGAVFTNGVAGQLRAVNTGGDDWRVEADTNGDATADLAILVTTSDGDAVTLGDFVL